MHIGEPGLPSRHRVDASGLLALPGFVDTHVHLMEPASAEREDWAHGTRAAAASGVTTVIEHTHAQPVRTEADLRAKREYLRSRSLVDFALAAHAWPTEVGGLGDLWNAGVAFFKRIHLRMPLERGAYFMAQFARPFAVDNAHKRHP